MTLRIGIPLVGSPAWHGGITYVEALLRAFRVLPKDEQPSLHLLVGAFDKKSLPSHSHLLKLVHEIIFFGFGSAEAKIFDLKVPYRAVESLFEVSELIDFIYPVNAGPLVGFPFASWLPDLQHKRMPEFFSSEDIRSRDKAISLVLDTADTIVLSSRCVERDFRRFYPQYRGRVEIVHFHTGIDDEIFAVSPESIATHYELPERFVICCNQFWRHKNHDILFKGLALCKEQVNLVCTGAFEDYRSVDWMRYLRSLIRELDIGHRVVLLGYIPRDHQMQLIKKAVCVVQPSLFEGWSTVLEDARSLGKLVLASNICAHREQNLTHAFYFDPTSQDEIHQLLDRVWSTGSPLAVTNVEDKARTEVVSLQVASARSLLKIAERQAQAVISRKSIADGAYWVRAEQLITSECYKIYGQLVEKEAAIHEKEAAIHEKEAAIHEKEAAIHEKEAAIDDLAKAIENHQSILSMRLVAGLLREVRRVVSLLRPRLGNLNQYPARGKVTYETAQILTPKLLPMPSISIVTPSYQQGLFLERTIRSVLEQRYPKLQYFIQDGGSRDNTIDVLKKYEEKISGWVSENDSGQSEAINRGFARTDGEIMAWPNSDDLLLPGALFAVAEFFNRHDEIEVVYGNRLLIDENDRDIGRWILPGHDSNVLSWADYIPQETLFWRRRIWEKVGGKVDESFRFAMDWDLLLRFRDAGARFGHIPAFLGAFRIHERQKTSASINEIGFQEMNKIRLRSLGRVPEDNEIRRALLPYLVKHVAVDFVFGVKKILTGKSTHSWWG